MSTMTEYYQQIIHPIKTFAEDGVTDEKSFNKMKRISVDDFEKILNILTNQPKINSFKDVGLSIYKMDLLKEKFEFYLDDNTYSQQVYNTVQISDTHLLLNIMNPLIMLEYFKGPHRYLFIQLSFFCESYESGHQVILMLDNQDGKAYLLDPNGSSSYFNSMYQEMIQKKMGINTDEKFTAFMSEIMYSYQDHMYSSMDIMLKKLELYSGKDETQNHENYFSEILQHSEKAIEKYAKENKLKVPEVVNQLIKRYNSEINLKNMHCDMTSYIDSMMVKYFKFLEQFGLKFEFVSAHKWNPERICLNRGLDNSQIGSGHCVILSLLLVHYIHETNLCPADVITILGHLDDRELVHLIYNYTANIVNLL